jgi:hypothetical protein
LDQNFLVSLQTADNGSLIRQGDNAQQIAFPGVGKAMGLQEAFEHLIPWDFFHIQTRAPLDRIIDNDADAHGPGQRAQAAQRYRPDGFSA